MAGLFSQLFQAREAELGSEEIGLEAIFISKDFIIGVEQFNAFGGTVCFTGGLQSPRIHASGTKGDNAQLFIQ